MAFLNDIPHQNIHLEIDREREGEMTCGEIAETQVTDCISSFSSWKTEIRLHPRSLTDKKMVGLHYYPFTAR